MINLDEIQREGNSLIKKNKISLPSVVPVR
jgi:hypothetical protein